MIETEDMAKKREHVDKIFLQELQARIERLQHQQTRYKAMCPCCRISQVGDEFIKETIGTLVVYDYGWEKRGPDLVYCPECGKCIWDNT